MVIAVLVTIPAKDAQNLAKMLLTERVCACVNIIEGGKSLFWGDGKIDDAQESLRVIKTKDTLFARLKTLVKNNHPYEVPEIISFKVDGVNQEYLDWINKEANALPFSS